MPPTPICQGNALWGTLDLPLGLQGSRLRPAMHDELRDESRGDAPASPNPDSPDSRGLRAEFASNGGISKARQSVRPRGGPFARSRLRRYAPIFGLIATRNDCFGRLRLAPCSGCQSRTEPTAPRAYILVADRNGVRYGQMRAVRARIFALFAALALLLPSGASARTQYYCRMMGRIIGAVSCDREAASHAVSPAKQLEDADCCQRLTSSSRSASLGTRDALGGFAVAPLLAPSFQPFGVCPDEAARDLCFESTQAPLAIGPPLFIVHCAFLS